jgi:phage gp36-like protein
MAAGTPDSGASAYASVTDLTDRFDIRTVQQLSSDADAPTPAGALATNPKVLAALSTSSGMVEAAVTVGRAYRIEDLEALTGNSLAFLKGLVCDLAIGRLILNRPSAKLEVPECYDAALETLAELRKGELVFGILENKQAGYLGDATETKAEVEARQGTVVEAGRFFSRRNARLHQ